MYLAFYGLPSQEPGRNDLKLISKRKQRNLTLSSWSNFLKLKTKRKGKMMMALTRVIMSMSLDLMINLEMMIVRTNKKEKHIYLYQCMMINND